MNKVKLNQVWKSKGSGIHVRVVRKASGNGHWIVTRAGRKGKSHHVHEGTLKKYYELTNKGDVNPVDRKNPNQQEVDK